MSTQMNRDGYKIYAQFVQSFLNKDKSFYQYKNSSDLGLTEKRLLKARQLLRQGDFNEMLEVLGEIKSNQVMFFEAEVNILKSQAYAFLLDFQNAALHNLSAHTLYRSVNDQFGIFISLYNLSVDYARLNLDTLSLHYLVQARSVAQTPNQKGLVLRADACRFAKENKRVEALCALKELQNILGDLNEFDRMNSLTVLGTVYSELGDYEEALNHLESIENRTFFETKHRLQLDFVLLQYLVKETPICSPQITLEENAVLHLQWRLLYLLSSGQVQMAQEVWSELGTVDPLFKNVAFCAYSKNDILGAVLAKIYRPKETEDYVLKGKLNDLFMTLKQSPLPLSKEELIERIWKIKYQSGFDDRLYKLVARLRKDFNVNIVSKSNGYFIAS